MSPGERVNAALALIDSDLAGAEAQLDEAVRLDPNGFEARLARAMVREKRQRPREAIDDLKVALRLNPTHEAAATLLAIDLQTVGELGEALEAWRRVFALAPTSHEASQRVSVLETHLAGPKRV